MPGHEEHWDRAFRLNWDPFQYQITKYVERWKDKNGVQDLEKALHFLQKYLELVREHPLAAKEPWWNPEPETIPAFLPDVMTAIEAKTGMPETKRSGFQRFTYEGGTAEWDLFTCKKCRAEVRIAANADPSQLHDCETATAP